MAQQRVFGTAAIRLLTRLDKDTSGIIASVLAPSAQYMLARVFKVHRIIDAETVKCFLTLDLPAFYQTLAWKHSFNDSDIEKYDAVHAIPSPLKVNGPRSLRHLLSRNVISMQDALDYAIMYGCVDEFDILHDGTSLRTNLTSWKLPLDRTRMIPNYLKYSHLIIANGGPCACAIIAELTSLNTLNVLASFHHLETLQAVHALTPHDISQYCYVPGAFDNATVPMLEWLDAVVKPDWSQTFATNKNSMDVFEYMIAHDATIHSTTLQQDAWLHDNHVRRYAFEHFHTIRLPESLYQWVWHTFKLSELPKQYLIYEICAWATLRGYYGLDVYTPYIDHDVDSTFKKYMREVGFKPRFVILCLRKPAVRCLRACVPYLRTLPPAQSSLLREQIRMHANPAISCYADL